MMKVAAYQALLLPLGSVAPALRLIRERIAGEAEGVEILCCPEAVLGGLADYAPSPGATAISADQLNAALALLASDSVTTIVRFTEIAKAGDFYNSAAVLHRGTVLGVSQAASRDQKSIYQSGDRTPVFTVVADTIVICNDSNHRSRHGDGGQVGPQCCSFPATTPCRRRRRMS